MPIYVPHAPTKKQLAFLLLPHLEAFYGGAAGGGKSDALLMGALQWVDVPKYSAIIFRKTLADALLPNSIYSRCNSWLAPFLSAKLVRKDGNTFTFPSGATLTFAYLADYNDKFHYQGPEFQYIGFDELTQFYEEDYTYLLSRLRRPKCPKHAGRVIPNPNGDGGIDSPLPDDPTCPDCIEYAPLAKVPLKMRAAANPGGQGHVWVKQRWQIRAATEPDPDNPGKTRPRCWKNGKPMFIGHHPTRPFIPALLADNAYLSQEEYAKSLAELDPVTREQLKWGDWGVTAEGRLKPGWVKRWSLNGPDILVLGANRQGHAVYVKDCFKFQIMDVAASKYAPPGPNTNFTQRAPSYSVIGTFLLTPTGDLVVWDMRRGRLELPELVKMIKTAYLLHRPGFLGMELTAVSTHLYQYCAKIGLPMKAFKPRSLDKLQRSIAIAIRMESGHVYFPEQGAPYAPWLEEFEGEIFTWTGHPDEQDDQVDVFAYAGEYLNDHVAEFAANTIAGVTGNVYADDLTPDVV